MHVFALDTTGSESSTPPFTRKSPLEVLFVNLLASDIFITLPLLLVSVPPFTESASVLLVSFNTESAVVHTADNFSAAFTVMLNNPGSTGITERTIATAINTAATLRKPPCFLTFLPIFFTPFNFISQ